MRWGHRTASALSLVGVLVLVVGSVGGDAPQRIEAGQSLLEPGPRRKLLSMLVGSFVIKSNPAALNPTFSVYPETLR